MAKQNPSSNRRDENKNEAAVPDLGISLAPVSADDDAADLILPVTGDSESENNVSDNNTPIENNEANKGAELSDEAKKVLAAAEGTSTPMLDIDSMPESADLVKLGVQAALMIAKKYDKKREEFRVGISGKEGKVQAYIEGLTAETDKNGFDLAEKISSLKDQIAKLNEELNKADAALLTHVEAELSKKGDGLWSEEKIAAKEQEIKELFAQFKKQYEATGLAIESHNKHAEEGEKVGELKQYVTHVDRPSGRAVSSTGSAPGSSSTGGGAGKPQISSARYSQDGGATWTRVSVTNSNNVELSNPAVLASKLGKFMGGKVEKADIWAALASELNMTPENFDASKVPPVSTFDFTQNGVTVKLELTRRAA